jgi:hypothetical protein
MLDADVLPCAMTETALDLDLCRESPKQPPGKRSANSKGPAFTSTVGPFLLRFVMCANLKCLHLGAVTFEAIGAVPRARLRSGWRPIDI